MDELSQKLLDLKEELYSNPLVVEYFHLKKAIEDDPELSALDSDIRKLQKELCFKNKRKNIEDDKALKQLKEKFDSHPLVIDYIKVKEELFILLNEIKEELES